MGAVIMFSFFPSKKKSLYSKLVKAFPAEFASDVEIICNALTLTSDAHLTVESYACNRRLYSEAATTWRLPSGETIAIPYRIYISDRLLFSGKLTPRQTLVYHCIFSRSYDGYIRQKHIEALLDLDPPVWAMPYIIKICDEYIKEILEIVYHKLKDTDCTPYKTLCALNFDYVRQGHARMISYWSEYYRYECYRYHEYIGKKLYGECFGYRKTGQQSISF